MQLYALGLIVPEPRIIGRAESHTSPFISPVSAHERNTDSTPLGLLHNTYK